MRVRPLTGPHGDMMPVNNLNQMLEGKEAVAQIAVARICLNYGEWWEDPTLGFKVPEFLAQTAKDSDINMLVQYITSYLSQTEGVTGIIDVDVAFENRQLVYKCIMKTNQGTAQVEVEINELV